ncbi:hypothetical protein [Polaromonas sp.]|uniref:hypothetical protein n=1 Tax=Polaromonas sp. TaxID=1869339 RepID=UPI00286C0F62|nr:hypothetical protein [Polaromonas sp.]
MKQRTLMAAAAASLLSTVLLAAPSFAQTAGASNAIPNAGSKQDPMVAPAVKRMAVTETDKMKRADVRAAANASHAIPDAGSRQDPQVDKPPVVTVSKEEKLAARAKRRAELAAGGSSSNPANPRSNPTGNAALDVQTSATPTSKS